MHIFQLIQKPQLRGAEIFASQLATHINNGEHVCTMVSIFKGDAELPFRGKHIKLERSLGSRLWDLKGWKELSTIIAKEKPDLIQANAGDTLKFAVFSKMIFQWKTPIIFRNANKISDFLNSGFKLKLNQFLVNRVSHVISVSRLCEKDFTNIFNYPEDKIDTVEIGIETPEIGYLPDDLESIFSKKPVLVNVGSLVNEKNHQGLINIFSKLKEKYADAQLVIIGKGPLEDQLKRLVSEIRLSDSIHFLGYRKDVMKIIKHSDLFLLPSLIEGLPGVILEAQYCQTPVIAYDVGGISEVVIDNKTGRLVSKNDEKGFINAIMETMKHSELTEKMSHNAFTQVTQHFSNESIALRFLEVYDKVCTSPS